MTEKSEETRKKEVKEKPAPPPEAVDLTDLVDRTAERITFLKKKQEELSKQKAELEDLKRQRQELDGGKREVLSNLGRAIAVLEKEESEFQRKHSLVQATKDEFKKIKKQVEEIREESWKAENIKEELSRALAVVSKGKREFREAQGKIEALTSRGLETAEKVRLPETAERVTAPAGPGDIFKQGFLFFIPAAILAVLVVLLLRLIARF